MKFIKVNLITLLLLLNITLSWAEQFKLIDINITGLNRTKYRSILSITDLQQGIYVDKTIEESVKQKLLAAGIFQSSIDVELEVISENTANININLMDKWTLIPLPVGFVSSDGWLAGGIFIESNLAGLNQKLISGVFASNDSVVGFAAWSNPSFLKSTYKVGLSTSVNSGLKEHKDITGEKVLASAEELNINLSTQIGNSFNSGFNWNLKSGFEIYSSESSTQYLRDFTDYYFVNSITMGWDNLYFSSYFQKGWDVDLSSKILLSLDRSEVSPIAELTLSKNILLKENLLKFVSKLGTHGSHRNYPIFIGGNDGSKALTANSVPVKSYISGSILFEPVIIKPRWGMFTLPVYYEGGVYRHLTEHKYITWHGPGIGFKFYIDKVAIPALGADFTWDLEHNTFKVVVSLGGTGGGS